MTPGIASSRAELSPPLLPPHLLPPWAVSHFGSAVSVSTAFLICSVKFISPSFCMLPMSSTASVSHSSALSLIPSFSPRSPSAFVGSLFLLPCLAPASSSNLFFLAFNLLFYNYMSSMTDQQRLVLQEKKSWDSVHKITVCTAGFTHDRHSSCAWNW